MREKSFIASVDLFFLTLLTFLKEYQTSSGTTVAVNYQNLLELSEEVGSVPVPPKSCCDPQICCVSLGSTPVVHPSIPRPTCGGEDGAEREKK